MIKLFRLLTASLLAYGILVLFSDRLMRANSSAATGPERSRVLAATGSKAFTDLQQSATSSIAAQADWYSAALYPVWGADNITGAQDIAASASLYCTGDSIIVEVRVIDDVLIENDDPLHCDHVEIWFALPDIQNSDYLAYGTGLFRHRDNPDSSLDPVQFAREHEFPQSEEELRRYGIYEYEIIDPARFYRQTVFFGMVHYGLFPGGRDPLRYDNEFYARSGMPADAATSIRHQLRRSANGYHLRAAFPPAALAFLQLPEMQDIRVMIDVIDVDHAGGRQESLLSSAPKHEWGQPRSFERVSLARPLAANMSSLPDSVFHIVERRPVMQYFGPGDWRFVAWRELWPDYYPSKVWDMLGLIRYEWDDYRYELRDTTVDGVQLSELREFDSRFSSEDSRFVSYIINGNAIKGFSHPAIMAPDGIPAYIRRSDYEEGNDDIESERSDDKVFVRLPDGGLGFFLLDSFQQSPWGRGPCGACIIVDVNFYRLSGTGIEQLFGLEYNLGNLWLRFDDERKIGFEEVFGLNIAWIEEGRHLRIRLMPDSDFLDEGAKPLARVDYHFSAHGVRRSLHSQE